MAKVFLWSQEGNSNWVEHPLRHCTKPVPKLILIYIRWELGVFHLWIISCKSWSFWSYVYLFQVKAVAEEMGLGFLGIGFEPKWPISSIPMMPKVSDSPARCIYQVILQYWIIYKVTFICALQGRYKIMREYMPKVGTRGHDMMFRTCTVQVSEATLYYFSSL